MKLLFDDCVQLQSIISLQVIHSCLCLSNVCDASYNNYMSIVKLVYINVGGNTIYRCVQFCIKPHSLKIIIVIHFLDVQPTGSPNDEFIQRHSWPNPNQYQETDLFINLQLSLQNRPTLPPTSRTILSMCSLIKHNFKQLESLVFLDKHPLMAVRTRLMRGFFVSFPVQLHASVWT